MSSLVLELQQDAIDPNVSVADLLRKSMLVARKLGLKEFEAWVNFEMNGYEKATEEIPAYRKLRGLPIAYSHYHGWYRLMTFNLSDDMIEKMTTFHFHQPISYFESTLKDRETIVVSYHPIAEKMLTKGLDNRAIPALQFDSTEFQGVLNAVKNIILEWTLRLEADGILGEDMTFTHEEIRKGSSTNLNIENLIGQVFQAEHHTQIREVRMGDTYEAGQVGAMGPNAHAHDMTLSQIWNQLQTSVDLSQLAAELSRLRQEMKKESVEPEQDIAVSEIAKAEQFAKSGDGSKTLEHLKSAGKWALDIATKIGTSLAVEALKKSMGE